MKCYKEKNIYYSAILHKLIKSYVLKLHITYEFTHYKNSFHKYTVENM